MAQQEEGWPLGLQQLNLRIGLARNVGDFYSGSTSFNTLLTGSPSSFSSTDSSSDLDTESTGSFFNDKSIPLGSLIGFHSILEFSRRSVRGRKAQFSENKKKNHKSKTWVFSLCSKSSTDAEIVNKTQSLGHFLAVERRQANVLKRSQSPSIYGEDELALADQPSAETKSLFIDSGVAPHDQSSPLLGSDSGRFQSREAESVNDYGVPVLFSCICGQPTSQ